MSLVIWPVALESAIVFASWIVLDESECLFSESVATSTPSPLSNGMTTLTSDDLETLSFRNGYARHYGNPTV